MGKMLEALKRAEGPKQIDESVLLEVDTEGALPDPMEAEMPFIEVGGPLPAKSASAPAPRQGNMPAPRRIADPAPRLEIPGPRTASLRIRHPSGITLRPASGRPASTVKSVAAELVTFHQPTHPVSQQYIALFGQLNVEPLDDVAPAFLFSALSRGAGATTCLLNLAIAGCQNHAKRIVVFDADHQHPAVDSRLGLTCCAGLQDLLGGKLGLQQAVHGTTIKGLHVLPFGSATDPAHLNVEGLRWILASLRQRFDLVLIDSPAWEEAGVARQLLPDVSAVYLVMDEAETEQPAVRTAMRDAARLGSRVGGLIVTQ